MGLPVRDCDPIIDGWPITFARNEGGQITTITVDTEDKSGNAVQFVKTLGYSGGNLATVSEWEIQ